MAENKQKTWTQWLGSWVWTSAKLPETLPATLPVGVKKTVATINYGVSIEELQRIKGALRPTETKAYPAKYPSRDPVIAEMTALHLKLQKQQVEECKNEHAFTCNVNFAGDVPEFNFRVPNPPLMAEMVESDTENEKRPLTPFPHVGTVSCTGKLKLKLAPIAESENRNCWSDPVRRRKLLEHKSLN